MSLGLWIFVGLVSTIGGFLLLVAIYDIFQRQHTILRNFPIIGHMRYILEGIGPELRQYIVTNSDQERPFTRNQRRWVYASSKKQNNYFSFGSDNSIELLPNYMIIKHAAFPYMPANHDPKAAPLIECAKVWGGPRQRKKAFRPESIMYISAMSYGSLSKQAVESLNRGAALAHCMHNTGEGSISPYHNFGGDLIWQVGTGYYGCRDEHGRFDLDRLVERCERFPVRAIEIKLSQGAKPGHGGVLPAGKITPEIAEIRGIPMGRDCVSPPGHTAFRNPDEMLDFVERIAEATGLPVGIKSAVGQMNFWQELATLMERGDRGVDYIAVDGGEGGTGAAPLAFTDHVAYPFKTGFPRVYREFAMRDLTDNLVFVGSGKLGFPHSALLAFALGCDMIAVAREAMLSIGCIQAQRCHTGRCPTGITTHNKWLTRGLDPALKSVRFANYALNLQFEIMELTHSIGISHPALATLEHFDVLGDDFRSLPSLQVFGYEPGWGLPPRAEQERLLAKTRPQKTHAPAPVTEELPAG